MRLSFAILLACLLSACVYTDKSNATSASPTGLWRLQKGAGIGAFDPARTRLHITDDGQMSSSVGCNTIGGKVTVEGRAIRFGPLMATRMGCLGGPMGEDIEPAYLAALERVRYFAIDGATLTLQDESSAPLLVFKAGTM